MILRRIISMSVILLLLVFFFTLGILLIIVGCAMSDSLVISSSLFGCFVSSCAAMFCTTVIGNTESPPTYGWDLAHERWIFDENILITNRDITPYVFEHEPVYIVKDGKDIIRRIISKNEFTADDDLCAIAYQPALPAKNDVIH